MKAIEQKIIKLDASLVGMIPLLFQVQKMAIFMYIM